MAAKPLGSLAYIEFGADPELFFSDAQGEIVGSDVVLPEAGLHSDSGGNNVIKDGVQAEFTLRSAHTCRQSMGGGFRSCFRLLEPILAPLNLKVDLRPVVEVSAANLAKLSDKARILGCAPSFNVYDRPSEKLDMIDATEFRQRSAGGHLHFTSQGAMDDPKRTVPLLDLLIGIPSVMLDRDPMIKERRELYGRAGEYRTPRLTKGHGAQIEYRTLSNYWLRSFQLMHLVTGLGRYAADVLYSRREHEILSLVDRDAVIEAINNNDFDAARKIWNSVKQLISEWSPHGSYSSRTPLWADMLPKFDVLVDEGIEKYWSAATAMERWTNKTHAPEYHGFERWIHGRPAPPIVVAMTPAAVLATAEPIPTVSVQDAQAAAKVAATTARRRAASKAAMAARRRGPNGRFVPVDAPVSA